MCRPVLLVVAAALAAGFAPAPPPRVSSSKADLGKMQGAWVRVALADDGGPPRASEGRIVIAGDRLKYMIGDKVSHEYALTLEAGKTPKWYVSRGVTGSAVGREFHGIYSVEGGTLKFGYNTPGEGRPKAMDGAGRGTFLEVYKREKP